MKYNFLVLLVCFLNSVMAQNTSSTLMDKFMKNHFDNQEVASKMLDYDRVAWVSSDSIVTLSDEELSTYKGQWFCYLDSAGVYHALYGAYESSYVLTAHYVVDSTNFDVKRSFDPFDTLRAVQYAKAYNLTLSRKMKYLGNQDRLKYNHYIFKNDSSITVHFLPAFQPNGYMVYGAEFHYTTNLDANEIIDSIEYINEYRAYQAKPNDEIYLNYENSELTTIGTTFYILYYSRYFKSIYLTTKYYLTTLSVNKMGNGTWIHAERRKPKKNKKKRK